MPFEDVPEGEPTGATPDPHFTTWLSDAPRLTVDKHPLFGYRGNTEVVTLMELEAKSR